MQASRFSIFDFFLIFWLLIPVLSLFFANARRGITRFDFLLMQLTFNGAYAQSLSEIFRVWVLLRRLIFGILGCLFLT